MASPTSPSLSLKNDSILPDHPDYVPSSMNPSNATTKSEDANCNDMDTTGSSLPNIATETPPKIKSETGDATQQEVQKPTAMDSAVDSTVKQEEAVTIGRADEDTKSEDATEMKNEKSENETGKDVKVEEENDAEEEEEEEEVLEEDEWKEEMMSNLDNVDFKGDFCIGKETKFPHFHPRITIKGMDERLAFPLPTFQAQQICGIAEKAPFGKGLDTVLDESVRKAWQVDASHVGMESPEIWNASVQSLAKDCAASLGLTGYQQASVKANLYKLLLYEPGGHFQKHRDTEKEPGMFGTMVVQLPSKHTGGGLVIYHGSETRKFDYSKESENECFVTAFYADCEHKFLPVTSGYRLCLVYNLVLQKQQQSSSELPTAQALTAQTQLLRKLSRQWPDNGQPMGYLLEHKYTETNLRFRNLKGRDKQVAELLQSVRGSDGRPLFVTSLLIIEKWQSGTCESSGGYYGRRGYYDDENSDGPHTMDEVYDSHVKADYWIGPNDEPLMSFKLGFDVEEQLLNHEGGEEDIFDDEEPDREEYEAYTGNAGPTLDYWYYKSVLVFWPRQMQTKIAASAGMDFVVSSLMASSVDSDVQEYGNQIINILQNKRETVGKKILNALIKTRNFEHFTEALNAAGRLALPEVAAAIVKGLQTFGSSESLKQAILGIFERTLKQPEPSHRYGRGAEDLKAAVEFLCVLRDAGFAALVPAVRDAILNGALADTRRLVQMESGRMEAQTSLLIPLLVNDNARLASFAEALVSHAPSKIGPVIDKFIEAMPSHAKTNEPLIRLAKARAEQLKVATMDGKPTFSWCQPKAKFPGSQSHTVNAFLRGPQQSMTLGGFNGIGHARNWCSKYFGGRCNGYSADANPAGRGNGACAMITKNKVAHETALRQYRKDRIELKKLVGTFGPIFGAIESPPKRRPESSNSSTRKRAKTATTVEAIGNEDDPIVL